ncbi:MAG: hypothetical protein Fur0034_21060 [Desulfuromonadia bacterium]
MCRLFPPLVNVKQIVWVVPVARARTAGQSSQGALHPITWQQKSPAREPNTLSIARF